MRHDHHCPDLPQPWLKGGAIGPAEQAAADLLQAGLAQDDAPHPAVGVRMREGLELRFQRYDCRSYDCRSYDCRSCDRRIQGQWAMLAATIVAGVAVLLLVMLAPWPSPSTLRSYQVQRGTVTVGPAGETAGGVGEHGAALPLNLELRAGQAGALVSNTGVGSIELKRGSVWQLSSAYLIALWQGQARFTVSPVPAGRRYMVTTPEATVLVVGTVFTVTRNANGQTMVAVDEGQVRVVTGRHDAILGSGQRWSSGQEAPAPDLSDLAFDLVFESASSRPFESASSRSPSYMRRKAQARKRLAPRGALFDKALRLTANGDYSSARQVYQLLGQEDGTTAEAALYMLARLELRLGHYDQALEALLAMERRCPAGKLAMERRLARVQVLYLLERCDLARAAAVSFRELHPDAASMMDIVESAARARARCL